MGCGSSKSTVDQQQQLHGVLENQMTTLVTMQQQQILKQKQMMQSDPDCKHLMEKQMEIQKTMMEAISRGDTNASAQAQYDMLELMINPKMTNMMMPDSSLLDGSGALGGRTIMKMQGQRVGNPFSNTISRDGPIIQMKGRRVGNPFNNNMTAY